MSEESERLRETLDHLHQELESTDSIDANLQEPLREIMEDIRNLLERSGEERAGFQASILERVNQLALQFETEHPTIAGTLSRLTHKLSDLGI